MSNLLVGAIQESSFVVTEGRHSSQGSGVEPGDRGIAAISHRLEALPMSGPSRKRQFTLYGTVGRSPGSPFRCRVATLVCGEAVSKPVTAELPHFHATRRRAQ
jgi:hypothetical protein